MSLHQRFNHETVALDGETYDGCEFVGCRLVYGGGEPPTFTDCRFDRCEWKYDDAAARTLAYLKVIWDAGAKPAVQAAIKDITTAAR
ncbi:MAG TPA: hypothetical protein VG939_13435 [Caulobacteraceae bacterium]|nr:hypothetical protein [Caulobacteraceae bacterium]